MTDKEERLVAEIREDLKDRARMDPRSIKEIVTSALEREFATGKTAAIERRIDERKDNIQRIQREINERERELAEEEDELERLKGMLNRYQDGKQEKLDKAREALEGTPREVDNPAIERWADELGLTPTELIEQL